MPQILYHFFAIAYSRNLIGADSHRIGSKKGILLMPVTPEIRVLSGGSMRSLLDEAVPLFERTSGAEVDVRFA